MYCPKCSQLQSSDEMRFCSRCGFALAGVAMLVDNEGVIPQLTGSPGQTKHLCRKRVMAESAMFTVVAWAVGLLATVWFDYGGAYESLAKIAAGLFFILGLIGLFRFMYGFLFVKDLVALPAGNALPSMAHQGVLAGTSRRAVLAAPRDFTDSDFPQRANTREIAPHPSVTENTTRLLEEAPTDRRD